MDDWLEDALLSSMHCAYVERGDDGRAPTAKPKREREVERDGGDIEQWPEQMVQPNECDVLEEEEEIPSVAINKDVMQ